MTTTSTTPAAPEAPVFARPALAWFLLLDGGVAALVPLAFSRSAYEKARETVPLPEQSQLRQLVVGTAVVHVGEAAFAYRRAKRLGLGDAAGRWALQTFVVGFPSLLAMRRVARARA